MHALLAYGSLIHPEELDSQGIDPHAATPVRVHGFRRTFCQEPSWREAPGPERAVLTVQPMRGEWFNALLVAGLDASTLPELDERERGYRRIQVGEGELEPYPGSGLDACAAVHLYTGRAEKYNERILPQREYQALCIAGARHWGAEFLRDFLRSTYVRAATPLLEHEPALARGV